MTDDAREQQLIDETLGALDALILYPADLVELIAFVAEEQTEGRGTCEPRPAFSEEQCNQ